MICDSETLELAQAIEQILAAVPDDVEGLVKPELMQSVLEIATTPCDGGEAGGRAGARAAPHGDRRRRRPGPGIGASGDPSLRALRGTGDRRPPSLSRARRRARLDRAARADLRHPHPRRDRQRREGDLHRRRDARLPAAPARHVLQLADVAGDDDADDVLAHAGLPRLPSGRHPALLRQLGDLLPPRRADDARRGDRGLHLPVVGRPAAPEPRHRRAAGVRPADAGRAHDRVRRARPVARPPALDGATTTASRASSTPGS